MPPRQGKARLLLQPCAVQNNAGRALKLFADLPPCFVLRRNMLPSGAPPSRAKGTTCWSASHCGTGEPTTRGNAARTSCCAMSPSSEMLTASAAAVRLPVAGRGLPECVTCDLQCACLPLPPHLATILTHQSQPCCPPSNNPPSDSWAHEACTKPGTTHRFLVPLKNGQAPEWAGRAVLVNTPGVGSFCLMRAWRQRHVSETGICHRLLYMRALLRQLPHCYPPAPPPSDMHRWRVLSALCRPPHQRAAPE